MSIETLFLAVKAGSLAGLIAAAGIVIAGECLNIKSNIIHQCSHNHLLPSRLLSRLLAEALGVLVLAPPVDVYARSHLGYHHKKALIASLDDEDVHFIQWLGFYPGISTDEAWRNFRRVLTSPGVHCQLLGRRMKENFLQGHPLRRAATWLWWMTVAGTTAAIGRADLVTLGYLLPITVLYQIGMMTYVVSEHLHFCHPAGDRSRDWHALMSHARFVGVPLPPAGLPIVSRIKAYGRFGIDMLGALVVRVMILPGELATHSAHHWRASADWTCAPYAYRDLKATMPQRARELWGLRNALQAVFEGMSRSGPPPTKHRDRDYFAEDAQQ